MSAEQSHAPVKVLVYSDDRVTRSDIRLALGRKVAGDLPEIEIFEVATGPAVDKAARSGEYDLIVLDAEATPLGGMGVAHQLKDELDDCPPILLLVARVADAWLATWSNADSIVSNPIDPVRLPAAAAELLRARLAVKA